MKKCKKIISGLLFFCMLIGSAFVSLNFMGVIGHTENMVNIDNENVVNADNENGDNVGTETAETTEYWHIVFKGFSFVITGCGGKSTTCSFNTTLFATRSINGALK